LTRCATRFTGVLVIDPPALKVIRRVTDAAENLHVIPNNSEADMR
jgi:hypothetical protein